MTSEGFLFTAVYGTGAAFLPRRTSSFVGDSSLLGVVGYQTQGLNSDAFTMVTVPFQHVNADGKGLLLNNDLKVEGVYGDPEWDTEKSDQIYIWDGIGYDKFYWDAGCEDDGDGGSWEPGWYWTDDFLTFEEKFPQGLAEGTGIFFKAQPGKKAMTGSGAVEMESEVEYPLNSAAFTMIGNPYPVATKFNDKEAIEIEGVYGDPEWDTEKSDQIYIWDGIGYDKFYWDAGCEDDGDGGSWEPGWYWTDDFLTFEEKFPDGLPAGVGIFFKAQAGTKKAIFKKPF